MKSTVDQKERNEVVAKAIFGGVCRALHAMHGMKCTKGVSAGALLRYAKIAGMLEAEEIVICQGYYGFF